PPVRFPPVDSLQSCRSKCVHSAPPSVITLGRTCEAMNGAPGRLYRRCRSKSGITAASPRRAISCCKPDEQISKRNCRYRQTLYRRPSHPAQPRASLSATCPFAVAIREQGREGVAANGPVPPVDKPLQGEVKWFMT